MSAATVNDVLRQHARVCAVQELGTAGTAGAEVFDRLMALAAKVLAAPVAALTLLTDERQYFRSQVGLPAALAAAGETPVGDSFCQHVVAGAQPFLVEDARRDPLVSGSPLVTEHGLIAYAGVPLSTPDGHVVGAFCVADHVPRRWAAADIEVLCELAQLATAELVGHSSRTLLGAPAVRRGARADVRVRDREPPPSGGQCGRHRAVRLYAC